MESPNKGTFGLKLMQKNVMSQPEVATAREHSQRDHNYAIGDMGDNRPNSFRASQLVKKHRKHKTALFGQES